MDQLRNKVEGKTLALNSLDDAFDDFLREHFFDQNYTLEIEEATYSEDGAVSVLEGKGSFLGVYGLSLSARFSWTEDGSIAVTLDYTLPTSWRFSHAFDALPVNAKDKALLDNILVTGGRLTVTNQVQTHPEYGVTIEPGVNFLGYFKPSLGLGKASLLLSEGTLVQGCIVRPKPMDDLSLPTLPIALDKKSYPWDFPDKLFGIHLWVAFSDKLSLGSMDVEDPLFHIYCPIDTTWSIYHKLYEPLLGVTGEIAWGDKAVEVIGTSVWDSDVYYLGLVCEGLTLGSITDLAGVVGTKSIDLPSPLTRVLKTVSNFEIEELGFGLSFSKKGFDISSIVLQWGAPSAKWKVWKEHIVLTAIGCRMTVSSPFGKPSYDIQVFGTALLDGQSFTMSASKVGGWRFMGSLQNIALQGVLKRLFPSFQPPGELVIDQVLITIAAEGGIRIMGGLAEDPGWKINVGKQNLKIQGISFDLAASWKGKFSGSFRGLVQMGDFTLQFVYASDGTWQLRCDVKEIAFGKMIHQVVKSKGNLPSSFNPKLQNVSVLVKQGVFQVGATVAKSSFLFEAAQKGFVVGMHLGNTKLSVVPGLSDLKALDKAVKLQSLTLVAADYASRDFRFPSMAVFDRPALNKQPVPQIASGIIPGLNLFASWNLDAGSKELKLLKKILGLKSALKTTIQVGKNPAKNTRLFVDYSGKVNKWPMTCQLGFALNQGTPEIFLQGELQAKIQKKPCTFDVAMAVVKTGLYFGGTMTGTVKIDQLTVSNLSLMFGMNWGGIPSLGIAGELDLKNFSSSIALLFDANDPSRCLLAGSISDLTLADVAKQFAAKKQLPAGLGKVLGQVSVHGTNPFVLPASVAQALDDQDIQGVATAFRGKKVTVSSATSDVLLVVQEKGKRWQLTDIRNNLTHYQLVKGKNGIRVSLEAQVYMAPNATQIGTQRFEQGFFLNGTLKILKLEWTSTVLVRAGKGISLDSALNKPLVIYKKEFFALTDAKGKTGPVISLATFNQPRHQTKMFRKPHFYMSGRLCMLGLELAEAFVQVSEKGLIFSFQENLALKIGCKSLSGSCAATYDLHGSVTSLDAINAGGSVKVAIKGKVQLAKMGGFAKNTPMSALKKLGSVQVNVSCKGAFDAGYQRKKAYAKLEGSFRFQGKSIKFKETLDVRGKTLAHAGDIAFDALKRFFRNMVSTAEKWANAVKNGLVEEAKDVDKVFKDVYKTSAKDAAKLMQNMGHSMNDVSKALKNTFKVDGKDAAKIFKGLGRSSKDVAKALKSTYKMGAKEVGSALKGAFKVSDKDMKKVLKGAGYAEKEVSKAFKSAGKKIKKIFKF